jgi:outer membrane protein OmpA-like peptidoglycan-associated protein
VPALRYTLVVQGDAQVRDWSLEALHPFMPQTSSHGTILQRQAPGDPPSYVDWQPGDSQREIPKSSDPVFAAFVVNGSEGETDTASNRLPIEYFSIARKVQERIGNLSVDRFRLPLFAYGNDKLLVAQADIINRYVRPELDPTAVIVVQAFTDRKGASTSNQSLSQQRADQIRSILKDVPASTVKGYGEGTEEQKAPFTNESPEGRLYNRTVEITLYKKIE